MVVLDKCQYNCYCMAYMCNICPCRDPANYTGISWFEAEDICRKDGGALASIISENDLEAVKFHFQNVANIYGQLVYVGLRKSEVSFKISFTKLVFNSKSVSKQPNILKACC